MGLGTIAAAFRRLVPFERVAGVVRRLNVEPLAWWVDLVKMEFGFLEQHGFELDRVHLHHEGNFVNYRNRDWLVSVSYEPDSTRLLDVHLVRTRELGLGSDPRFRSLGSIVGHEHVPPQLAPSALTDRAAVAETVRKLATTLRVNIDKVLRSA